MADDMTPDPFVQDDPKRPGGQLDFQAVAGQYAELTRQGAGRSQDGFVFDRQATHVRRGDARRQPNDSSSPM